MYAKCDTQSNWLANNNVHCALDANILGSSQVAQPRLALGVRVRVRVVLGLGLCGSTYIFWVFIARFTKRSMPHPNTDGFWGSGLEPEANVQPDGQGVQGITRKTQMTFRRYWVALQLRWLTAMVD